MLRGMPVLDRGMHQGGPWGGSGVLGRQLAGMELGVVSLSSTARALLPLLAPFHCDVLAYDPYVTEPQAAALGVRLGTLEEVMARPVVSVHLPVLPSTKGVITKEMLALIPDGGLFVNSSRAYVLDEDALIRELASGRISAALDVFDTEPLPQDSPFRTFRNALLTPHIAGASVQCYQSLMRGVVEDILAASEGGPVRYEIDPAKWDIMA